MIEMGIEASILRLILEGRKTVEGRLRTAKFVTLRKGDKISFREDTWEDDRVVASIPGKATVTITETKFYDSFADMFADVDYHDVVPNASSAAAAVDIHRQFYTPAQEREHGVVAIRFSLQ